MKRIITWVLALVLVTGMFTSTALASSMADLQGLRDYLEANLGKQQAFSDSEQKVGDFFSLDYLIDEENGEWVGIVATGTGIDSVAKDIENIEDTTKLVIIELFLNVGGIMAKLSKQYGVTDKRVIFLYTTDEDTVGKVMNYAIVSCVDDDLVQVTKDDLFGLDVSLSLSKNYDSNYFFDFDSLSN